MEMIDEEKLETLHKQYGNLPFLRRERYPEQVWQHSIIVGRIALQLGANYQARTEIAIDTDLIKKGALVHDIGVYKSGIEDRHHLYSEASRIGSQILYDEGYPYELMVFPIVTCGPYYRNAFLRKYLSEEEIRVPVIEELLIRYANHFHTLSHEGPSFISYKEAYRRAKVQSKASSRRFMILREEFGIPDLSVLKERYKTWHEEMAKIYAGVPVTA